MLGPILIIVGFAVTMFAQASEGHFSMAVASLLLGIANGIIFYAN